MKQFYILFFLTLLALACSGGSESTESNSNNDTQAAAEIDAERIWKVRCVACHGIYGDMEANGAANLQEVDSPLEYRIEVITNGKGVMTPWEGILSEEEIVAMAEYTMDFNPDL